MVLTMADVHISASIDQPVMSVCALVTCLVVSTALCLSVCLSVCLFVCMSVCHTGPL